MAHQMFLLSGPRPSDFAAEGLRLPAMSGIVSWVLILSLSLLFDVAFAHAADKLVLLSTHWEGIRYEFERAFKAQYQAETGREAVLEWMDVGGTSEALHFIR